jgi:hypothetical protein
MKPTTRVVLPLAITIAALSALLVALAAAVLVHGASAAGSHATLFVGTSAGANTG